MIQDLIQDIDDIVSDYRIMNNDMVFTEIKISPLDST